MASSAGAVRARVKQIVETEFAAEGITVESDKIPRASGHDGRFRVACYPEAERERTRQVDQLEIPVVLQFYPPFVADIDENQAVDPTIIENYADRLRSAFRNNSSGTSNHFWFLRLRQIEYTDDPTGNKTRFDAYITGYAENAAGTY